MAEATYVGEGKYVDFTTTPARVSGEVVVQNNLVGIAVRPIGALAVGALATQGVFDVVQAAVTFVVGQSVYWDEDGTCVGGGATGAAVENPSLGPLMGMALEATEATDETVRVRLWSQEPLATGSLEANDITGSDASLGIAGLEAAQGGAIVVTGGVSTTTGNAGGAVSVTGGQGGATGAGGAASVVGGTSGATSGTGGAAALTGGAAGSSAGNAVGGAATVTGGAGKGNLAGGAVSATGGAGGATGAGGAASVTGGAGGATSGTGGAVTIAGGAGTNGNADGGAVTINGGAKNGSGADGAITIGSTAASLTLGKMPRLPINSNVAVGGTGIGNANAVSEGITRVTGADDTAAVILPVAAAGMQVLLISTTASKNLAVFPQVNSIINNLGANNVFTSVTDAPHLWFVAVSATQWYCFADVAG